MFGNLGFGVLLEILGIVLVVFCAKRIPEIGAWFVEGAREFRRNVREMERSIVDPDPNAEHGADYRAGAGAPRVDSAISEDVRPDARKLT